jgi:hypothetical protein
MTASRAQHSAAQFPPLDLAQTRMTFAPSSKASPQIAHEPGYCAVIQPGLPYTIRPLTITRHAPFASDTRTSVRRR